MPLFRALLVAIILIVGVYTSITISSHGIGLYAVFFGDMAEMTWRGQFNLDFLCFLILSGVWVAWRHEFTATGLVLGFAAFNLGAPFLAGYLLVQSYRTNGNVPAMLLGEARAARTR
ncbi:hypothetical protein [Sphingorhabdus sp.]|uniref:hypothetical protein n=1 Tax=Sphingorhabdus sp. TaxID=1902408 RepID=UPI003982EF1F